MIKHQLGAIKIHNQCILYKICTICYLYTVQPSIVENPVMMQEVYPGEMVKFSCRAEGFSMLRYSWFMVAAGTDTGMEIVNETNTAYIITNAMHNIHNATGYYCIASNNEGIAVSITSTVIGNECSVTVILL